MKSPSSSRPSAADRSAERWFWTALLLALLAGSYLHFSNLRGAVYLAEDEARPFTLMSSGPLMFLMGRPLYGIFKEQSSVFYLCGALGFLSIPLFAFTARLLAGPRIAALATVFFAVWPLRLTYARTLFPSVFVEFYFFLSLACLTAGLRSPKAAWSLAAGCFAAMIFFAHSYGYSLILGLFAFTVFAELCRGRLEMPGAAWKRPVLFAAGGILTSLALYWVLRRFFGGYDYLQMTFGFKDYTQHWSAHEISMFELLWRQMTQTPLSAALGAASLAGFGWVMCRSAIRRDARLVLLAVPFVFGFGVFLVFSALKVHTLYDRHCVWLVALAAVGVAGVLDALRRSGGRPTAVLSWVLAAGLTAFMAADSHAVTRETFSIRPIRAWLKDHGIVNRQVLTSWWQINSRHVPGPARRVPGGLVKIATGDSASWYIGESGRKAVAYRINWPAVLEAYRTDGRRYLLTSGIDLQASLGSDEPLLANVTPLQSWPHPYAAFKRRPYARAQRTIRLYDLNDVFSAENAQAVHRAAQDKRRSG